MKRYVDWSYLDSNLFNEQAAIERAKVVNESRDRLQAECTQLEELATDLQVYRETLRLLLTRVIAENDHFRSHRLEYLSGAITDAIAEVFPDKDLEAKVTCDFKRKNAVDLCLIDSSGCESKPFISNGKLMQYLISFASVSKIAESLGCNNLFIDEAFGVASEDNLPVIGDIVAKKVAEGMQIILVSQNSALYADIPHRAISLEYDSVGKKVVLKGIEDKN